MDTRTNPTPKRGMRNIFCPFYSNCLDTAIQRKWFSWNCAKCEQRANREGEPEIPLHVNYSVVYYELAAKA